MKFLLIGAAASIILFPIIIIVRNKPDFSFWLFLNLYFDPGGYVSGFLGGNIFWRINISDVFILLMIICVLSPKIKRKVIYNNDLFLKFIKYFLLFAGYYFIVYGWVAPYLNNDLDYGTFLLKNRTFIYGFIILISVYIFALRRLDYFYSITLFFGVVSLSLYWITLLTGIVLTPVIEMERHLGSGMIRIAMAGYGYFYMMFPLAVITYLLSRKLKINIKYKNWLFYGGTMMVLTILLTLTRRTYIDIIGIILIIIFITSYIFRTAKLSSLLKTALPAMIIMLILFISFPKYLDYTSDLVEDTFRLITGGKDTRGVEDYRVTGTGDLIAAKFFINKNLWLGAGYTYLYWGEKGFASSLRGSDFSRAADAAGEVPIYYLFFGFGLIGALFILPLYIVMGKLFLKLLKFLKRNFNYHLTDPYLIIFSIYVLLMIASKFTISFWRLGSDFRGSQFSSTAILLGIGFALIKKWEANLK